MNEYVNYSVGVQSLYNLFLWLGNHFGVETHEANVQALHWNEMPRKWELIALQGMQISIAFSVPQIGGGYEEWSAYARLRIGSPMKIFKEFGVPEFLELLIPPKGAWHSGNRIQFAPHFSQYLPLDSEMMLVASTALWGMSVTLHEEMQKSVESGEDDSFLRALEYPFGLANRLLQDPEKPNT